MFIFIPPGRLGLASQSSPSSCAGCLPAKGLCQDPGSSSGSDEPRPPGFTLIFPLLKFIVYIELIREICVMWVAGKQIFFFLLSFFSVFFQTISFLGWVQKKLPSPANQPCFIAALESDKRDGLQTSSLFIWLPDSVETWLPPLTCLRGLITVLLLLCLLKIYIFNWFKPRNS